jgi:hypothetical protein
MKSFYRDQVPAKIGNAGIEQAIRLMAATSVAGDCDEIHIHIQKHNRNRDGCEGEDGR